MFNWYSTIAIGQEIISRPNSDLPIDKLMPFVCSPRYLTATLTLISQIWMTVAPAVVYAQDAANEEPVQMVPLEDYARVGGGSLSTAGDRASAAAGAGGDEDQSGALDGARASSGRGIEREPAQNADGESDLPGENEGVPSEKDENEGEGADTETLGLPTGGDKSGVTSQAISIPKGAGSIKGMEESFSAQLSTGIATFSVPFALMKGRGGAQPSLGLSYSSAGGTGPAGQGWSVGVPFIARQTDRGLPQYHDRAEWRSDQDRFVFNGGQELVPICTIGDRGACAGALTGELMPSWAQGYQYFRARVEGSFLRFFWAADHESWIVQDKSGTIMEIGDVNNNGPAPGGLHLAGQEALERNANNAQEIYRWHLSRQYDQFVVDTVPQNLVVYDYMSIEGQSYVTDIYDTTPALDASSTDVNAFAHHTHLAWENKPDRTESYRSGWRIAASQRLVRLDVASKQFLAGASAARSQVRRYHLTYSEDYHRSLLTQVQVEGRCGTREDSSETPREAAGFLAKVTGCGRLPAMKFAYSKVEGFEPDGKGARSSLTGYMPFDGRAQSLANSPRHSIDEALTDFYDINSDGLPDVLVTAPGLYQNGHAVFFNGEGGVHGFGPDTNMSVDGVLGANAGSITLKNLNLSAQDLDGDGRVNFVHMPRVKKYSIYDPQNIDGKWAWVGRVIETASNQNVKIDFGKDTRGTQVVDVNFDGLVDVVVSTGTEYQTFFSLGRYPGGDGQFGSAWRTGARSATISNDPVRTCVPHSALPVRLSDADTKLADMNGDGIVDIVRVRRGDIQYWPGRGNGFWGTGKRDDCEAGTFGANRYKEMSNAPQYSDIQGSTLRVNDVNGDGLADLVQIRFDAVDIWLNVDGQGWTKRQILDGTPYHAGFNNRVRLMDVNGSGTPDILYGDSKDYKYIDLQGGKKPYLLTGVENGLGKSTELEYSTSTEEMLAAAATGAKCGSAPETDRFAAAWCSFSPTIAHVVKRVIERDNITLRGRPPAEYVTEYEYRDPVYEGRQREFRGFARARARRIGDGNSPTDVSESVFLLGQCMDPANGSLWNGKGQTHYCAPARRWEDNAYEALKGLPVETHKMDAQGVHLASTENEYTIRTLYEGLDGRAVRHAFLSQTDSLLYDTAAGKTRRVAIERRGFVDDDHLNPNAEASAPSAYAGGMAHLRTVSTVDKFGNKLDSNNLGCVGGSECAQNFGLLPDKSIVKHTVPQLLTHDGHWMWRTVETYVDEGGGGEKRQHSFTTFDAWGQPISTSVELTGVEAGGAIRRTGGAGTPGQEATSGRHIVSSTAYNALGLAVRTRGANRRCAEVTYGGGGSGDYSLFATSESLSIADTLVSLGADSAQSACASGAGGLLTTTASYDHGMGAVKLAMDLNLRATLANYDEFGRITSLHKPSVAGASYQTLPSVVIEYTLPMGSDGVETGLKHSVIHTKTQDGASEADGQNWIESYAYVDGFGRTLVTLSEADPSTGRGAGNDGGTWIAGSLIEWDQKSAVSKKYMPFFWSGADPMRFDYGSRPTTEYGRQRYDAFGRQVQTFDLDGTITLQSRYHALSTDLWDAADLTPGQHQGSYASTRKDGHGRAVRTTERFRASGALEERHVVTSYLPTGEPTSLKRVGRGQEITRWMRYDSLGRMLLNVDAHTSTGFSTAVDASEAGIEAWRYQYNLAGDLIATSDARGCGQNFYYDGAGRIVGEDYVPCEAEHAEYSKPIGGRDYRNFEVAYFYDDSSNLPPEFQAVAPDANASLGTPDWVSSTNRNTGFSNGRAIAVFDRGSASFTTYDGRGRTPLVQTKLAAPIELDAQGKAVAPELAERYAGRVYQRTMAFDAADREVRSSTGLESLTREQGGALVKRVPELLSSEGESYVTTAYSKRGAVMAAGSSYGSLVEKITRTADNLVTGIQYGDIAKTTTAYLYDERRRISSVQTYRGPPASGAWDSANPNSSSVIPGEPTRQLVLQDEDFIYDIVGNPVEIRDWRDPADWPVGAKPVTKKLEYDDLYRATRIKYEYAAGDDVWKSPFQHELDTPEAERDPRQAEPSPHIKFDRRMLEQTFEYDWLGNNEKTGDDANGFYDRSLGETVGDDGANKPYQMKSASLGGARGGSLEAKYDAAGNMVAMSLLRDGECLGGDCNQKFVYDWDEVGRLVRARRWDGDHSGVNAAVTGTLAADLRHYYDASDQRVIKEAVDGAGETSYTLYVFASMELRRTQFGAGFADGPDALEEDFEVSSETVVAYLMANGVRLARLVYHGDDTVPEEGVLTTGGAGEVNASTSKLHVFFELGDHLGSTSVVLDKATGELVERATFQAYGGAESDYRPDRWKNFREDYRFTGKEEDVEVGLQYFGKRFLNPLLGRWISADPLAVHAPGEADLNLYAYVHGTVLASTDPLGLQCTGAGQTETCDGGASESDGSVSQSDGSTSTEDASSDADQSYNQIESGVKRYEAQAAAVDEKVNKRNEADSLPGQELVVKAVEAVMPEVKLAPGESTQSEISQLEDAKQVTMVGTAVVATAPLLYFGLATAGVVGYAGLTGTASGLSSTALIAGGASLGAGLGGLGEIGYGYNNYQNGGDGFSLEGYLKSTVQGGAVGAFGTAAMVATQSFAVFQGLTALETAGAMSMTGTSIALGSATLSIAMGTSGGDAVRGGAIDGLGAVFTPFSVLNVAARWSDGERDAN